MKLALGTVQFGLDYGVANASGKVVPEEVARILATARNAGFDTLDTAAAYGESESVLGFADVDGWRIVSKLPPAIPDGVSGSEWVKVSVRSSLARLCQTRLDAILLHRPAQLLGPGGEEIYRSLQELKSDGVISRIGISIYGPEELDHLCHLFDFDVVQAPLSIVDRRLISSGWMGKLAAKGVEIHARSAFLQGLLLMDNGCRPKAFARWQPLWRDFEDWLADEGISAMEACIRYSISHAEVGRVVVGVQSQTQLLELVDASTRGGLDAPDHLASDSEDLLNPGRWASLS